MTAPNGSFHETFEDLMARARQKGDGAAGLARRAAYLALGRDPAREAAAWTLAAALDPLDAAAPLALSRLKARAGDFASAREAAAAVFNGAVDQADRGAAALALGEIALARRDQTEAQAAFEAARRIAELMLAVDPADADAAHDLAEARQRLAELALGQGDWARGRGEHEAALALMNGLAVQRPDDQSLMADRAFSRLRLADLSLLHRRNAEARAHLDEARALYRALAAQAADPRMLDEALAAAHALEAALAGLTGDEAGAQASADAELRLRQRAARDAPGREAPLIEAWRRRAALHDTAGRADLASAARAQARALATILTERAPDDDDAAREFMSTLFEEAAASSDPESARRLYAQACVFADKRLAAKPDDEERQRALAAAWDRLGALGARAGRHGAAQDAFARAVALARLIHAKAPLDLGRTQTLAALLLKLGAAARAARDLTAARAALTESYTLRLGLVERAKRDSAALKDLAVALEQLGLTAEAAGATQEAADAWREELSLSARIFAPGDLEKLRFDSRVHGLLAGLHLPDSAAHKRAALTALDDLAGAGMLTPTDAALRARLWRTP